jgi:hypothetical protein
MGFGCPTEVLQQLCRYAKVNSEQHGEKIEYLFSGGDSLPADVQFDVVCCDNSSLQFKIFCANGAKTGMDVLNSLQARVNEDCARLGARLFFFCFDDSRFVTSAKRREQALRVVDRTKRKIQTYDDMIELTDGSKIENAKYQYGLNKPLPKDFQSVLATPALLKRASAFLCTLLAHHVKRPASLDESTPLEFYISGYRLVTQEQVTVRRLFTKSDSTLSNGPAIHIGEAEGQCMYWIHHVLKFQSHFPYRRFLVRANDSDAIAILLMNAHALLAPTGKFDGQLWLDNTAKTSNLRMLDIGRLFMRLRHYADFQLKLHNCAEMILVVGMLCGNDICMGMPQLGPATLFAQVDEMLRQLRKSEDYLFLFDPHTLDMMIDEKHLVALIAHAYVSINAVAKIFAKTNLKHMAEEMKDGSVWLTDPRKQEQFFQTLWRLTNSISEPAWMRGQTPIKTPSYEDVRANVRRAFYSLYYYRNIGSVNNLLSAELEDADGFSLFGHTNLSQSILPGEEKTNGLARLVSKQATGQPFVDKMRNEKPTTKKRSQEEVMLDHRLEQHIKHTRTVGECDPILSAIYRDAERLQLQTPDESQKALHRLVRAEQAIVVEALRSSSPNEAWIDIPLRNSTPPTSCPNEHGSHLPKNK